MAAELDLSGVNERRLGTLARRLEVGRSGRLTLAAGWVTGAGLAAHRASHASSAPFLHGGLAFRFAWVAAGKAPPPTPW